MWGAAFTIAIFVCVVFFVGLIVEHKYWERKTRMQTMRSMLMVFISTLIGTLLAQSVLTPASTQAFMVQDIPVFLDPPNM